MIETRNETIEHLALRKVLFNEIAIVISASKYFYLIFLFILLAITVHAQDIVGIIPVQGRSSSEAEVSRLFAHALRTSLAERGYRTVSDSNDPIMEEMLLELVRMGDTGSKALFEKLEAHSRAEEFILVDYQSSFLKIDWKNAIGETVSGASLQFIDNYRPEDHILQRAMRYVILPQLLGLPSESDGKILSFFVPGYGHLKKGYRGKGSLLLALGIGGLSSAGICLAQAISNYDLSISAANTSIRNYHYQTSQAFAYAAIGSMVLYLGTAIISGTSNTKILDYDLDRVIAR